MLEVHLYQLLKGFQQKCFRLRRKKNPYFGFLLLPTLSVSVKNDRLISFIYIIYKISLLFNDFFHFLGYSFGPTKQTPTRRFPKEVAVKGHSANSRRKITLEKRRTLSIYDNLFNHCFRRV